MLIFLIFMLKHVMVVLFYRIFQIILVHYIFVKFEGLVEKTKTLSNITVKFSFYTYLIYDSQASFFVENCVNTYHSVYVEVNEKMIE
jgi:hypothetical protein